MDAPLASPGAFDHNDPQADPQPLPKELRDDTRRGLALLQRLGPLGSAVFGLYIWAGGICAYGAFNSVGAESAANVAAATHAVLGLIAFAQANHIAAVVVPHVLAQLDEARLSTTGAATLSKTMKGIKALVGYQTLFVGGISVVIAIESDPKAPHEWVAAGLLVALTPALAVVATLSQLAIELTYLLAADAAYQVAAAVHRVTAATADYDGLAKRVYRVHLDTVALSEKMTPMIFWGATAQFLCTLMFLFYAVGPRPLPGDEWFGLGNWYNFFCHEYTMAVAATICAGQLVWILSGPAKITSACQKIASAVNDLRINAGDDGTVTLATSEQGHRIEILNRYINELNKNQGLGFLVARKRITFTLVMGLLIQTVSAMLVVSSTLMSIATVEGEEEQEIVKEDQAIEVTNRGLMDCLQVLLGQQADGEVDQQVLADCVQAQSAGLPEPKGSGR